MFEMDKLDPKALADGFAKLVEEQIGAKVKVSLHKFERTNPGYTNDRVFIGFAMTEDWASNIFEERYGQSEGASDFEQTVSDDGPAEHST